MKTKTNKNLALAVIALLLAGSVAFMVAPATNINGKISVFKMFMSNSYGASPDGGNGIMKRMINKFMFFMHTTNNTPATSLPDLTIDSNSLRTEVINGHYVVHGSIRNANSNSSSGPGGFSIKVARTVLPPLQLPVNVFQTINTQIAGGASLNFDVTMDAIQTTTRDDYTRPGYLIHQTFGPIFTITVDSAGTVAETNENNNQIDYTEPSGGGEDGY